MDPWVPKKTFGISVAWFSCDYKFSDDKTDEAVTVKLAFDNL